MEFAHFIKDSRSQYAILQCDLKGAFACWDKFVVHCMLGLVVSVSTPPCYRLEAWWLPSALLGRLGIDQLPV